MGILRCNKYDLLDSPRRDTILLVKLHRRADNEILPRVYSDTP